MRKRITPAPLKKHVRAGLSRLAVRQVAGLGKHRGRLHAGPLAIACALGASGIRIGKREGDHATPAGRYRILEARFRADRLSRPRGHLKFRVLRQTDGWCDDPLAAAYNRAVQLPVDAGHETMWRADGLYDLVFVLDYNVLPRRKGFGSAIFLHCARENFGPTEGCVALARADLRRLLPMLSAKTHIIIG
jgi:L,D-peptidoglycan transpeptidase YkuD (ErfK/YbiS/YcfS/YnhG family)